jgi:hypothetical protein
MVDPALTEEPDTGVIETTVEWLVVCGNIHLIEI